MSLGNRAVCLKQHHESVMPTMGSQVCEEVGGVLPLPLSAEENEIYGNYFNDLKRYSGNGVMLDFHGIFDSSNNVYDWHRISNREPLKYAEWFSGDEQTFSDPSFFGANAVCSAFTSWSNNSWVLYNCSGRRIDIVCERPMQGKISMKKLMTYR